MYFGLGYSPKSKRLGSGKHVKPTLCRLVWLPSPHTLDLVVHQVQVPWVWQTCWTHITWTWLTVKSCTLDLVIHQIQTSWVLRTCHTHVTWTWQSDLADCQVHALWTWLSTKYRCFGSGKHARPTLYGLNWLLSLRTLDLAFRQVQTLWV
jgi:hypothetical protein